MYFLHFTLYIVVFGNSLFYSLGNDVSVSIQNWETGFVVQISVQISSQILDGWRLKINFDQEIENQNSNNFQIWNGEVKVFTSNSLTIENKNYNKILYPSSNLQLGFRATKIIPTNREPVVEIAYFSSLANLPPSTQATPSSTSGIQTTQTNLLSGLQLLETGNPEYRNFWNLNQQYNKFEQKIDLRVQEGIANGWVLKIIFSFEIYQFETWNGVVRQQSADRLTVYIENKSYNPYLAPCNKLTLVYHALVQSSRTQQPTAYVELYGNPVSTGNLCSTEFPSTNPSTVKTTPTTKQTVATTQTAQSTVKTTSTTTTLSTPSSTSATSTNQQTTKVSTTTPNPTTTRTAQTNCSAYNYDEVLAKSILFYEAQRSGYLPLNNRVLWRHNSTTTDQGDNGLDLTGGWFDAGDYVKFGLPMASSTTFLAWGIIEFREAYQRSGQLDYALDSIKWTLDYFIKCHPEPNVFYAQVAEGTLDHQFWTRPEDIPYVRRSFKLSTSQPGSEVAAETAAAMAAGSIVFRSTDASYADLLLQHAKQLFDFANNYRGRYTNSIPDATQFYNSNGYNDELAWASVWLLRATKSTAYADLSKQLSGLINQYGYWFSWDDKNAGAMMLNHILRPEFSILTDFSSSIANFVNSWTNQRSTPKGLKWLIEWGPNRYSANAAFLSLVAAKYEILPVQAKNFAKSQIHYMLGSGGRSFVVGYGCNPPKRPHHRASSCPAEGPCGFEYLRKDADNPNELTGALVGGPELYDDYTDDRTDFQKNEVATDYNAGFQSAVAGLKWYECCQPA